MTIHEQKTQYFEHPIPNETYSPPVDSHSEEAIYLPVPRRGKRPFLRTLLESATVSLFFIMGALALLAAILFYQSDRIIPGVAVMGIELGQYNRTEAKIVLQREWNAQTVTLVDGLETWTVHPNELGIRLDAPATIEQAYQQGRTRASWQLFIQNQGRFPIQPVWAIDPAVAEQFLQQLAVERNRAPQNATLHIVNGRIETVTAVDGVELDIAATQRRLLDNAEPIALNGRLPLITTTTPAAISDVSAYVAQAEQLLGASVTVNAYDPIADLSVAWVITPEIWSEWLLLDIDQADPSDFAWQLDQAQANAYFDERMVALGDGRTVDVAEVVTAVTQAIQAGGGELNLRIYHQTTSYQVQPGDTLASIGRQVGIPYPYIQAANPGINGLTVGQTIVIPSLDVMLPLPIVENKRIIVSISEQRVRVYENGALKWDWLGSTGIAESPTAPGIFQIQSHDPNAYAANWDLWMPDFMGVYKPVPGVDFMNGFHGFPTRDGYNLLWTQNLGAPVTYGCILLSNENVSLLYDWAEDGVIVEIVE